jgi:hypothetical protein
MVGNKLRERIYYLSSRFYDYNCREELRAILHQIVLNDKRKTYEKQNE